MIYLVSGEFRFTMLMLCILSSIGVSFLLVIMYSYFNRKCKCKFRYTFLDNDVYCSQCGKFKGHIN